MLYPEEQFAKDFLENIGLNVTPVPTGTKKTPEFIVTNDQYDYVVEVKSRKDAEGWEKDLVTKNIAEEVRPMAYDRWVTDVAAKAIKQMKQRDPKKESIWILWLSIDCNAATDTMFNQAISSLFGAREVVDLGGLNETKNMWTCLYSAPSTFERYPDICAAVVVCGNGITLCVNEESAEFNKFTQSILYREFSTLHPPISHSDLTENRNYLTLKGSGLDRRDEQRVTLYLKEKYNLENPIFIDLKTHSATTRVFA